MSVRASFKLMAKLLGSWTDVSTDWAQAENLSARRGMEDGGPLARVAGIGVMTFAMKNGPDGVSPSRPLGYYSPNHSNCRAGWTFDIEMQLLGTYGAVVDEPLWTGRLQAVEPVPGQYGARLALCTAHDCFGDFASNDVRSIPPQSGETENDLIQAIFDALPTAVQPASVDYDTSLDTYDYALTNASRGTKALSLMLDVLTSAQAFGYPKANGVPKIENRQARTLATVGYAFAETELDELEVPSDRGSVFDQARVTIHPPDVDAAATTVLYAMGARVAVAPGQTVEVWGDYADPTNTKTLIGGIAQVTPIVITTDYTGNSASDGSGSNLSTDLSISTSAFAASVLFEITNNGSSTVWALCQIRGKGIYDPAPQSFSAGTGARILDVDLKYQDDAAVAQALADYLYAQYSSLADQVNGLSFNPQKSAALMAQALTGEIGDVISVTETMTGASAVEAVIQAIELEIIGGPHLHVRYITAPRGPTASFIWSVSNWDAADSKWAYA